MRSCTIKFTPPLPAIPKDTPANEDKSYEWEKICADRLKEMEKSAKRTLEGRSTIVVVNYVPPNDVASFLAIAQFVLLTILIVVWLQMGENIPFIGTFLAEKIFEKEWKFNAMVLFHAAILVKRWSDVLTMAKKLKKHNVERLKWALGPWLYWLVTAFFEGWRALQRFDEEVARVGRQMAEKGGEDSKKKK